MVEAGCLVGGEVLAGDGLRQMGWDGMRICNYDTKLSKDAINMAIISPFSFST